MCLKLQVYFYLIKSYLFKLVLLEFYIPWSQTVIVYTISKSKNLFSLISKLTYSAYANLNKYKIVEKRKKNQSPITEVLVTFFDIFSSSVV